MTFYPYVRDMSGPADGILLIPAFPADIAHLSAQLPEFSDPYNAEIISNRLSRVRHWSYMATVEGVPAAFKVGYERATDGSFYSWLGGVLPPFRRQGLAQRLAAAMEAWAAGAGYSCLRFKTRNRHREMLHFALRQGFDIVGVDPHPDRTEHRIWLEKDL